MRKYNIPIFIPHEGCPHDCTFCNQRKITGVETSVTPESVRDYISEYLGYIPCENRETEVAFFGGSFTGLPLEIQEEFYKAANTYRKSIDGIRLSTRPDYINKEVLDLAKKWGVTTIELGAQSAFDDVLSKNNRGHSFSDTMKSVKMIKEYGVFVGLQMMTGMYGSSREKDIETAKRLAELNPDCVRIYPTLVLKDTALEKLYIDGEYLPQTIEDAIECAKEMLCVFKDKDIPVIRLGLHSGEEIREEGTIVAGPFHPAFGELVESRIWRERIEKEIKNTAKDGAITVAVPSTDVSKAIGHKRSNAEYFEEKYGLKLKIIEKTI